MKTNFIFLSLSSPFFSENFPYSMEYSHEIYENIAMLCDELAFRFNWMQQENLKKLSRIQKEFVNTIARAHHPSVFMCVCVYVNYTYIVFLHSVLCACVICIHRLLSLS